MSIKDELENIEVTHTVFKNEHLKHLSPDGYEALMLVFDELQHVRGGTNRYMVINHDESWIEEVVEIMKKNNSWG